MALVCSALLLPLCAQTSPSSLGDSCMEGVFTGEFRDGNGPCAWSRLLLPNRVISNNTLLCCAGAWGSLGLKTQGCWQLLPVLVVSLALVNPWGCD